VLALEHTLRSLKYIRELKRQIDLLLAGVAALQEALDEGKPEDNYIKRR
jgi:hypothetical protein